MAQIIMNMHMHYHDYHVFYWKKDVLLNDKFEERALFAGLQWKIVALLILGGLHKRQKSLSDKKSKT